MTVQRNFCYQSHMTPLLLCTLLPLLLFRESAHGCYSCFSTPEERTRVCNFVHSLEKMSAMECLEKIKMGFAPLDNILIPYLLVTKVKVYLVSFHKAVREIQTSLPPHDWHTALEKKIGDYIHGVQEIISSKPAENCKPPCGLQKAARKFNCNECAEEDCLLPVMCPLQVINVKELSKTIMDCSVSFILPNYVTVIWRFARNVRVTDLSYFQYMHRGEELDALIKPTRFFHQGTYSCEILDEDEDVIAEKFFFVNVTRAKFNSESKLQRVFLMMTKSNIAPEPEEVTRSYFSFKQLFQSQDLSIRTCIFITAAIALVFVLLTLLVGAGFLYATDVD